MKPLNNDDPGCNYTTSNCVIWQGPDIECIKLCKGDTISDVVAKLATELCEILDVLDISSYDLSCFNLTACKPDDFKQLIQFLIGRVCKLEQCTGCIPDCNGNSTSTQIGPPRLARNGSSDCPDCVVNIASCFYFTNELGDTITSMQLQDYVIAIGNRICSNAGSINTIQGVVTNHANRIQALEDAPTPVVSIPQIVPACVINPGTPTDIDIVTQALENQFCELRAATGLPTELFTGIQLQPPGLDSEVALNGSGNNMSAFTGWSSPVTNLADSIGNLWIAYTDMRQAIRTIQLNCCPTGCDGIELTLTAAISGDNIILYINGTIPSGFQQCLPGGTRFTITDSYGASVNFNVDIIGFLNNPSGFTFGMGGTPLNPAADMHIEAEPCLTNPATNATCKSCLSYNLVNTSSCPSVTYNVSQTTIAYTFTSTTGTKTYSVELWNSNNSTMISNQIQVITGVQVVTGTFTGLTAGVNYNARVTITTNGVTVTCPFQPLMTNPPTCPPPEDVTSSIVIT